MDSLDIFTATNNGDLDQVRRWYWTNRMASGSRTTRIQNLRDDLGLSPLTYAVQHLPVLRFFIEECGIDPIMHREHEVARQTFLHIAAGMGCVETVKYLVNSCKMDPMILNGFNETACGCCLAMLRSETRCMEIVGFFVEDCGVDVNYKENVGFDLLHNAVAHSTLDMVKYLVDENDASYTVQNDNGHSAVGLAVFKGKTNMLRFFLRRDPGLLHYRSTDGGSLLHLAVASKDIEVVNFLVTEAHIDTTETCHEQCTALMNTCGFGFYEAAVCIVNGCERRALRTMLGAQDSSGWTVFHFVANTEGNLLILRMLWEISKFRLCKRDLVSIAANDGSTPLHRACICGDVEMVEFLVQECEIDCSCPDKDGYTPLHYCSKYGHDQIVRYLVERNGASTSARTSQEFYSWTPLMFACSEGHLEVVKYLTSVDSSSASVTDSDGQSCLHIACEKGEVDIVRHLVEECHVDHCVKDEDGYTPLFCACGRGGSLIVVKYFIELLQVDAFVRTKKGSSVLFNATSNNDIFQYLCARGFDVHERNLVGNTPLFSTVAEGCLGDVKHLVERFGVRADIVNARGESPLHWAMMYNDDVEVAKYLLEELHLSVNDVDVDGRSPAHIACTKKIDNDAFVKYLVTESGADLFLEDRLGCTPFHHVCQHGSLDLIFAMMSHGSVIETLCASCRHEMMRFTS